MNNDELTTTVYRAVELETPFIRIEIADSNNKLWFEGHLYTEQNQSKPKIENLDQKIKEAIRNIPDHF